MAFFACNRPREKINLLWCVCCVLHGGSFNAYDVMKLNKKIAIIAKEVKIVVPLIT